MNNLPRPIVIENVLQYKMRGKVAYQSYLPSSTALNVTYVKHYDHPAGKGYQRPVDNKRSTDFAIYLSKGDDALFTPILLNAAGNWEFSAYDNIRTSYGRLVCKGKASLMDGQHRIGGIERYIQETNSELNIPFLAFHHLDEDEEIQLFDTINTKAKGIGTSLSKYLRRDSDEYSWIATELITRPESPFHNIGSIVGKRSRGRHVTLQNLYRTVHYLFKEQKMLGINNEEKYQIALNYYRSIKDIFSKEWIDYGEYRITHIVCLDALSIAGSKVLTKSMNDRGRIDYNLMNKHVKKLSSMDWSSDGSLKYLKGIGGSKSLAIDLIDMMLLS
ncbi:DGQHR domain-containing protein [Paenibacillus macquariensis]|uniref:DNA sulfur modification protein DndB n=1 Tax=Paenibacillus macquariensis TaxID=948756 RepID=A0ABY1JW47_9BACL|nr:DGQHR domain-containing protein [Paenibacillus macquariensis]MEC0094356.1 DGQHR domain-containing protein [Paenibacillus macquariensis]OAB34391.1 hypothetical protein PMSM_10955 [Paenibacillus macquariensis subsp. macquariensis]SIQ87628.1 DNA sulfur modification protein DndB [Paenibacillus macquariensis]